IVVLEHAADSGKRTLEVTTKDYKYYLFDVTVQLDNYLYILKFDTTLSPQIITEVTNSFAIEVL
ncbi:hypothetical protein GYA27_04355, partial [candidate division WWE3 bacterium]|nr:hypothetical protein [candidate division WWE3 bacterium]